MTYPPVGRAVVCLLGLALTAAACGGGTDAAEDPTTTVAPSTEPTQASTTTEAANLLAVSSLEDAEAAVIRIVAEGSFVDPEFGEQLNVAGSGSGFIIDEAGIAVTNNHVVTGAAFLDVFVGGSGDPLNARVLGVSECSDLAVIDIEGDGYTHLEWFEGDLSVGTDVFTAGFPLGDPEFTLTRGIISKESADGETNWASVDSVLEHDATINPGNSGGPLITADGQVVGVNYAGASTTSQYFAISRDEALTVIEQLRAGEDITSLGINGQAVAFEDLGLFGVWVASVEAGSPADQAGVQPGDIVTTLQGLVLGTDGTLSDYCDILRSNGPEDVLAIEVYRSSTDEVLEGRINESPLEVTTAFAQEIDAGDDGTQTGTAYTDFVSVQDDTAAIQVSVPAEWVDLNGAPREAGPSIVAAPSVEGLFNGWEVPGVEVFATKSVSASDIDAILDGFVADFIDGSVCTEASTRDEYEDPLYKGRWQLFSSCGGTDTSLLYVVAAPEGGDFVVIVWVQVVTDADLDAIDRILDTFVVIDEDF